MPLGKQYGFYQVSIAPHFSDSPIQCMIHFGTLNGSVGVIRHSKQHSYLILANQSKLLTHSYSTRSLPSKRAGVVALLVIWIICVLCLFIRLQQNPIIAQFGIMHFFENLSQHRYCKLNCMCDMLLPLKHVANKGSLNYTSSHTYTAS